ncbi:MAG: polyprenol monophosphomannose synthase [Candidatus ainarchaeum sp.]|nr:polyprenol monophosphomannose synthase [Candidatus ainarchaeum sp.]
MLSIIIPTYNERDNIIPLLSRLEKSLNKEHEVIFVDDNSPDGTASCVEEAMKTYRCVRLLKRKKKQGLTAAIVAGAAAAKGGYLVIMDSDISHPPEKVPALVSALDNHDLVIGSRMLEGGGVASWPFHRKIISIGADFLARAMLGVSVSDPMSGFFAIRKEVFKKTKFRTRGYKILLNILADNPRIRISEVPYVFSDRHSGRTKLGAGEIFTYVLDIIRLRFT